MKEKASPARKIVVLSKAKKTGRQSKSRFSMRRYKPLCTECTGFSVIFEWTSADISASEPLPLWLP